MRSVPVPSDDELTMAPGSTPRPAAPTTPTTPSFAPGAILAGRYRLVALLGRGGMGEVYRADDLILDHPVALKFLPERDPNEDGTAAAARLAQFHNELRLARQVSHKNVCRLYDLGEADGRRFLTMEYVDGEDLASLLRRIGRLPPDKAIDIARQICAGLAAAHERGVLHRDLKPANVMLDGDGNVRITDFGLATVEGDTSAVHAGTPQYMAPEQLGRPSDGSSGAGTAPASVRTDIYALGLVLFEIFTGRRVYEAKTLEHLRQLQESGPATTPSALVRDLDPAVERAILRCLEREPSRRPASALAVAASLPGGDPLAAALAAGETPSPDMLAAAGETRVLPIARGITLAACCIGGIVAIAAMATRASVAGRVPLDKPPAVLVDRVQSIVRTLGYTDTPADEAYDFLVIDDYVRWIARSDPSPHRWDVLAAGSPPALALWYRSSPRELASIRHGGIDVTPNDPPLNDSGMILALVDTEGRLIEFHAVPPQFDADAGSPPAPRWRELFDAAGLSMAAFKPADPQWTPRDFADTRAAWEGPLPRRPDISVRIEAAAYRGRPISFYMVGPWSRASRMQPLQRSTLDRLVNGFLLAMLLILLAGAAALARHNSRLGRGNWRGATRFACIILGVVFVEWVAVGHHVPNFALEFRSFVRVFQIGTAAAVLVCILYVAVEPYGRRFWPDGLLGWTRLMAGYVRDPRVGRDVLIGSLFGVAILLTGLARTLLPAALGYSAVVPGYGDEVGTLTTTTAIVGVWGDAILNAPATAFLAAIIFIGLRLVLRRRSIAIVVTTIVAAVVVTSTVATVRWLDVTLQLAVAALATAVVVRFGLLAAAVAFTIWTIGNGIPFTTRLGHWSATPSNLTIAALVALVVFGFTASRAGQPLFGKPLD
jgi:tRNA A-37 threonylcarbamoyl transferase component Bud32